MIKTVKIMALLFIAVMFLCSCSRNSNFHGGVLLDSEKMSEIKSEIFATESKEAENVSENDETIAVGETDKDAELVETTKAETTESVEITTNEKTTETALDHTEEIPETKEHESEHNKNTDETTAAGEENGIVYWTKSGGVWHSSRDCRYIKNSEVESGSVDDAIAAGKERVCSSCSK